MKTWLINQKDNHWLFDNLPSCVTSGYYPPNIDNLIDTQKCFFDIDNLTPPQFLIKKKTYLTIMKKKKKRKKKPTNTDWVLLWIFLG